MSIKLITVDGNTIPAAVDSQLFNGLSVHSASSVYANFIISGGEYEYKTQHLTINKMKAVGCGRMFEITDTEDVLVAAPVRGTNVYTVVFRMKPYDEYTKIQTLAIPLGDTLYSDDISTGSGIYDVQYATVAVNSNSSATILQLLHKSAVWETRISDSDSFNAGDHVPIPTSEAVKNYVTKKLGGSYTDEDINKFFSIGKDKEIEFVKLYGSQTDGFLTLGDNGLELSLAGKMSLAHLMNEMLLSTNDFLNASIDDIEDENVFSAIITLSDEYNSKLFKLFERKAVAGFLTTRTFEQDGIIQSVQIVFPIADGDIPPVAIRSKLTNTVWGEWKVGGVPTTENLLEGSVDWHIDGKNHFSTITVISSEQNSQLYELYNGAVDVVFVSTRNFKFSDSDVTYSKQIAYPFTDPSSGENYPTASRTGIKEEGGAGHVGLGTLWGLWQLDAPTPSDISSDFGEFNSAIDYTGDRVVQVVKNGNVINGSIVLSGNFSAEQLDDMTEIFIISEKYRPVLDYICPSLSCMSSENEGADIELTNAFCTITSSGEISIAFNTDKTWNTVYISFTYVSNG